MPFSILQILVLPIVILDRDREAHSGKAGVEELGMVAAAAEAVVAPDLHDVEVEVGPSRSASVSRKRRVARRRSHSLAA